MSKIEIEKSLLVNLTKHLGHLVRLQDAEFIAADPDLKANINQAIAAISEEPFDTSEGYGFESEAVEDFYKASSPEQLNENIYSLCTTDFLCTLDDMDLSSLQKKKILAEYSAHGCEVELDWNEAIQNAINSQFETIIDDEFFANNKDIPFSDRDIVVEVDTDHNNRSNIKLSDFYILSTPASEGYFKGKVKLAPASEGKNRAGLYNTYATLNELNLGRVHCYEKDVEKFIPIVLKFWQEASD